MPLVNLLGSAEVTNEDYYEYEIPPNLEIRLEIDSRTFKLLLGNDPAKRSNSDIWYNKALLYEIIQ